jgi:rubrerythrin
MPVQYSAPEVMEMAVQTEKGGKLFYETVAAQQKDARLKGLFEFLAGEEANHITTFEQIARAVKVAPAEEPYNWEEVIPYLRAMTESRYFLGSGTALALAKESATPLDALKNAMAFEKETLVFYIQVRDMVSQHNRAAVDKLINEEKAHVRKLAGIIEALKQ